MEQTTVNTWANKNCVEASLILYFSNVCICNHSQNHQNPFLVNKHLCGSMKYKIPFNKDIKLPQHSWWLLTFIFNTTQTFFGNTNAIKPTNHRDSWTELTVLCTTARAWANPTGYPRGLILILQNQSWRVQTLILKWVTTKCLTSLRFTTHTLLWYQCQFSQLHRTVLLQIELSHSQSTDCLH
jgi:hypothetical protein